jgi:putative membrane protein
MENSVQIKRLNTAAVIVSVIVLLLVAAMRRIKLDVGIDFSFLPAIYSLSNLGAAICLILGLYFIKNKDIANHKRMVTTALIMSFLFLLMYVVYHITTPETKYCGEGSIRTVYFFLLITHVVLAAVSFPFILFTYIRGFTMQVEKHRRMARWVYWVWLYVAITGPVIYIMLRPCMSR